MKNKKTPKKRCTAQDRNKSLFENASSSSGSEAEGGGVSHQPCESFAMKIRRIPQKCPLKNRNKSLFEDASSGSEDEDILPVPLKRQKLNEISSSKWNEDDDLLDSRNDLLDHRNDLSERNDFMDDTNDKDSNYESMEEEVIDAIRNTQHISSSENSKYIYSSSEKHTQTNKKNFRTELGQRSRTPLNFKDKESVKKGVKQSTISFQGSPSPALVNEGDVSREFIVNDIPINKRKRQGKIDFKVDHISREVSEATTQPKRKSVNKKNTAVQKKLDLFTEIQIEDDEGDILIHNNQQQVNQTLFRVKVRINEQFFLISCKNSSEFTVSWLINKVNFLFKISLILCSICDTIH